jgi:CubicO group peptidase (beta-lactamase class C family)
LFYKRHLFDPLGVTVEASNASSDARAVPLDMAHICQMLLNGGAYGSKRFLRSATLEKMLPQRLTRTLGKDASMVYGIGTIWITESGMPAGTFTHGAASSATSWIDPTHRLVICMTRNSAGRNFEKYHPMFIKAILDNLA